ncbi:MAG: methionine--tRNA ligase [Clostridia bacterium]|nr:methionine--tRNA ligase [Clostridia bacterium]
MNEKFYITTAIAYTSRKPHIGNTYEAVFTDAIARYNRLRGKDVFFLTGTDEHGVKIQEAAEAAGIAPKEYVDRVAGEVRETWDLMNTSYDKFIRTTDPDHERVVSEIFTKLYKQGDIYKGEYSGKYCVACETYYTDSQLVDGKCPDCGGAVVEAKEEAYFFRMSKYADRLIKHIEEHPEFIMPESRRKEMVNNFLLPGLNDLCVSRTSFSWGVPVEFDPGHVVYVWIDALSNYITALGYDVDKDKQGEKYKKYWPADIHVIGKDILRFHTIYWPIILMALGEPLPKQVFGHPWLLNGTDKMSKSKGNTIYADELCKYFTVDGVRLYLLSEMPYNADGTITYEAVIRKYNTELANNLGNLVSRTVAMTKKYFGGETPTPILAGEPVDDELIAACRNTAHTVCEKMDELRVADAVDAVFELLGRANKYIDETAPWVLAKTDEGRERLGVVIYNLLETIRHAAVLLAPFMPATSEKILSIFDCKADWNRLESFGQLQTGTELEDCGILFARIDEEKLLAEIFADKE